MCIYIHTFDGAVKCDVYYFAQKFGHVRFCNSGLTGPEIDENEKSICKMQIIVDGEYSKCIVALIGGKAMEKVYIGTFETVRTERRARLVRWSPVICGVMALVSASLCIAAAARLAEYHQHAIEDARV